MYAIVRTGGKQYRVEEKNILAIDKLEGAAGDIITFEDVLSIGDVDVPKFGVPTVPGATVTATIVEQGKAKKIDAFTYCAMLVRSGISMRPPNVQKDACLSQGRQAWHIAAEWGIVLVNRM
jgi:large subunit ribosomal protein L21